MIRHGEGGLRRFGVGSVTLLWLLLGAPEGARAQFLTGKVRAADAEAIYVPPSNSSPVVLRYYVPEGAQVAPGDVLVRIDPGESASQLRTLAAQIEQAKARADQEVAELAVKAVDAERALIDAEAALAKAKLDAGIPRQFLSALDADRYRSELNRAEREQALKRRELAAATEAQRRRGRDAQLEVGKLEADLRFHQLQVTMAEQRAKRAGTVVHGFDSWRGQRFDEGSSAYPGNKIGEVVADGLMSVRAYALEPDRAALRLEQAVLLAFDALPGRSARGRIVRIAGAPSAKNEWGDGRWFDVDIAFDGEPGLVLKPGMSVRVQPVPAGAARLVPAPKAASGAGEPLRVDGELFARRSIPLMPPSVDQLWQLNITQLAGDGSAVKKDQPVLSFEGGEINKRVVEMRSALKEKQSQRDKLRLELAERERNERLMSEEHRALRDKAQRKAGQPETLLPSIAYRKLVIEREQAERQLERIERREALAAEQRRQELRLVESEVAQLQDEVAILEAGVAALTLTAPRDGVMLHKADWQGNKFDVGSQVWRGQAVAEIPDPESMAVRAQLPEHEWERIALGMRAKVQVDGGGVVLSARVGEIGRVVRSKSRLQPVPVVDVLLELDGVNHKLKPGQGVTVELPPAPALAKEGA